MQGTIKTYLERLLTRIPEATFPDRCFWPFLTFTVLYFAWEWVR
jgi:hypothetical protein